MAGKTPETLDAKYIAEVLGRPLTAALSEVAEKRPWDPIEYLAQWLYKYKSNQAYHQQLIDAVREAELSEQQKKEESESRTRRRQEAEQLKEVEEQKLQAKAEEEKKMKEQEELQKKAKESIHLAQPPELATVTEEDAETSATAPAAPVISPRTVVEKDEEGLTKLHKLAESGTVEDLKALLATPEAVDLLSERDVQGRNARDMAASDEIRNCLDDYVTELFKGEKIAEITKLMENGYPLASLNLNSEELGLPEASTELLAKATDLPALLEEIGNKVKTGELRTVRQSIERKAQAVSRLNADGATALHLAVLTGKNDVIQYIVSNYPSTVQCRDHMNRTPLHYAHALPAAVCAAVVKLLTGADESATDCKGRKPDQLTGTHELKDMAELLVSAEEVAAAAAEQPPADGEQAPEEAEQSPAAGGEQAPAADSGEQAPAAEAEQTEQPPAATE